MVNAPVELLSKDVRRRKWEEISTDPNNAQCTMHPFAYALVAFCGSRLSPLALERARGRHIMPPLAPSSLWQGAGRIALSPLSLWQASGARAGSLTLGMRRGSPPAGESRGLRPCRRRGCAQSAGSSRAGRRAACRTPPPRESSMRRERMEWTRRERERKRKTSDACSVTT